MLIGEKVTLNWIDGFSLYAETVWRAGKVVLKWWHDEKQGPCGAHCAPNNERCLFVAQENTSCRAWNIHTSQVRAAVVVCLMQLSFLEVHKPENKTVSQKAEMRSIQIHWQ